MLVYLMDWKKLNLCDSVLFVVYDVILINNARLRANGNHGEHLLDLSKRLCSRGKNLPRNSQLVKPIDCAESGLIAIRFSILNALISRKDVDGRKKGLSNVVRRARGCKPRMKVDRSAVVRRINAMCIVHHTYMTYMNICIVEYTHT